MKLHGFPIRKPVKYPAIPAPGALASGKDRTGWVPHPLRGWGTALPGPLAMSGDRACAFLRPLAAVATTVIGLCHGCAPNNKDMLHFLREHEHHVSAIEYRVGVPDAIGISAPRILEIDGEAQVIQPDGKINFRLLGEVKVVGMTAREVAAKLEVLLGKYYLDPKVRVRIVGYASKKYYVHGQAASGPRIYTGRDTLLDAVLGSGVDFLSWTSRVEVTRPSHDETPPRSIMVNVSKMLRTGDWSKNILLEPDDVVYIPPTPIAWFGQRIRELLYPFNPAIDAYLAPADVMWANNAYKYLNDGRTGSSGSSRTRSRGGRSY